MAYEKTLYQKINTVADWIIRIIMLNIMMIISSLAIITIYPSLTAGYKMFYQYVHKDEEKLFKGYIQYFLEDIGKKIVVGLVIFVIIGLGYLNVTYYVDLLNAEGNILYTIGYYLTLAVLVSSFIITLYSLAVMHILPKLKLTLMFKLGFYLSGKFIFRTILLVLTVTVPFLLLLTPITMVLFVFTGLSIPVLLNVLITDKVVDYVEGLVKTMFKVGIENLDQHLDLFKGKKVGLITNPTGINRDLKSTIDILREKTELVALYAPEHGVRGDLQAGVRLETYQDEKTECMVYSLYGKDKKPSYDMLKDIDVLCFDIQDVGARFYTFLYTMAYAMMAAKEFGKKFVVFDRPNPVGGVEVEGNLLDLNYRSFVGYYPIVERYGLTIGEMAYFFNETYDINCDLEVIKMSGYQRDKDYDDLDFPWIFPSPNIPTVQTTYAYLATCYFEGTNLSEGRGTTKPFEIVGAPWLKSELLIQELKKLNLEGVHFRTLYFTPTFSKHKDQLCEGIEVIIKDKKTFKPVKTGLAMLYLAKQLHEEFKWLPPFKEGMNRFAESLMGDDFMTKRDVSLNDIFKQIEQDSKAFTKLKGTYHIYE